MYHSVPSRRRTEIPLQGLHAMGAITSYYRLPTYVCVYDKVKAEAKKICVRKDFKWKPGDTFPSSKSEPYGITLDRLKSKWFNPCAIADQDFPICGKPEVAPPTASKPPPTPKPPTPPVAPPSPEEDLPIQPEYSQPAPPYQAPPQAPADEPIQVFVENDEEVFTPAFDPEPSDPEPEEDNNSTYLVVGGLLALVVGGGLVYYVSRKKKRR